MTTKRETTLTPITAGFVLLLSALVAIGPLTIDLYLAAFPQIITDLSTTAPKVQLTLTATLAGLALGQLLVGSISDAVGRRRPLLAAMALYVVVSATIVATHSIELLTALRFVQGLSAAAGMVLSIAIVRDNFSGFQVGKVIARLMLVVGVAPILAPTIGSQLLRLGSWRLMFALLAVVGAILLVIAYFRLQESLPPARRRVGGAGAALRSYGELFRDWQFLGLALLNGFYLAAMFAYVSSSSFVFQDSFGLSEQQFGLIFGVGAIAITAGSQINGFLIGRVSPERILVVAMAAGFVLSGILFATTLISSATPGSGLWTLVALLVLTLSTAGFVMPSAPAIALEHNAHRAGSAAALLGALQFGIGAAIAPVTGLLGGDPATTMTAVMFAVITIAGVILIAVRSRAPRTAPMVGSVAVPGSVPSAGADGQGARPVGQTADRDAVGDGLLERLDV